MCDVREQKLIENDIFYLNIPRLPEVKPLGLWEQVVKPIGSLAGSGLTVVKVGPKQ